MLKKLTQIFISHISVIVLIALIAVCFVISMFSIEKYAKDDCIDHIEETTSQAVVEFNHIMEQNQTQLMMFANILAANDVTSNTPEQLRKYLKNFCDTQNFSAVCVHRADSGDPVSYGYHVHEANESESFETERNRVPYTSPVFSAGKNRKEQYFYLAVPIVRENEGVKNVSAILYGYISLDTLPKFISSTAYDGKAKFFIIDGSTGNFIMNEYYREDEEGNEIPLGNVHGDSLKNVETKGTATFEDFYRDVQHLQAGYVTYKLQSYDEWYYNYHKPIGINKWSMHMVVDEETAFASYNSVKSTMFILMACVIVIIAILISIFFIRNAKAKKANIASLKKADYLNAVQSALISAHNNPDFVDQALKIVAEEVEAETALLLTFTDKVITQAQYWPSKDKSQAMALLGVNVRDAFPAFFDLLSSKKSAFYDVALQSFDISDNAKEIFMALEVSNIMLVPIMDNASVLKGAIAAVNLTDQYKSSEMLECVTRDFFMAMTNLENHNIIKNMGAMDYLTGLKNRNSYESEITTYETLEAESLWCVFIDANGLHLLNNEKGHSAGDAMLCVVADSIKKIFGANNSYRLGGDEFVAFKENSSHEEFMGLKHRLLSETKRKGYSISVGFEGVEKNENGIFDVEKVVADAEVIMYRDKWEYYKKNNILTDRGHFPSIITDSEDK